MNRVLTATLGTAVAGLAVFFGGVSGLLYLALVGLACVPGLPLGWRLLGRAHPVGWVAGALFGYGLTALAFWVPIRLGAPGFFSFLAAWLVLTALVWRLVGPRPASHVTLPAWSARDTAIWLLVLHLVLAFVALPFARVGERDASGTKYYRAYFTADFLWHVALTQEVAKFEVPPTNPYLAPDPIHYYWAYFVVPAVLAGPESSPLVAVEDALRINATAIALLLASMVFFAAWSACGVASAAALATILAVFAPSLEGLYEVVDIWKRHDSLNALRSVNIDAITAWRFGGLRVDSLLRSMWYTPQHATSMALGLIAIATAARLRSAHPGAHLLTGLALGLSVVMNPFLGAAFCVIYGCVAIIDPLLTRLSWRTIGAQALSAVPVVLALAWGVFNRMSEGAGGAVIFGRFSAARSAPVYNFFLSVGGLVLPALTGLWGWRRYPWRPALAGLFGLGVGIFLMYFVHLNVDLAWVGFRSGNVLQITLPMLVARGFAGLAGAGLRGVSIAIFAGALLVGAPTTLIDTFNAQDIENREMGPDFLWTIPITPAQQAGFEYVRQTAGPDAIVQADPIVRKRQNWTIIPSFAGRRMAAGKPISLLDQPEYERRSQLAHAILTKLPPADAHASAKALGIELLWIDQDDGAAGPAAVAQFMTRPDLFTIAFRRGDVSVVRVK